MGHLAAYTGIASPPQTSRGARQRFLAKRLPTRPADRMSSAMRCGASEPIRLKLSCAREGANLGGGWSRARDPRLPVQLHNCALARRLRQRPGRARTQLSCANSLCSPPEVGRLLPGPEPSPVAGSKASERGRLGTGGLRTPYAEGVRPLRGGLPQPPGCTAARAGLARDSSAGASERLSPEPEPGACPRLGGGAHSPSLRHSAVSTRASTTQTLASMALAGGGRTEAGRGGEAAAESESAAAGGARPAL